MEMGFTVDQYEDILKALTNPIARVEGFYPYSDLLMFTGNILGTTFTGHPSKTTFGNTLRQLFAARYLHHEYLLKIRMTYGVDSIAYEFISGDDTILIIEAKYADIHKNLVELHFYLGEKEGITVIGCGILLRDLAYNLKVFNFLSKDFFYHDGRTFCFRQPLRTLFTGAYTHSLSKNLTLEQQRFNIIKSLEDNTDKQTLYSRIVAYMN